MTIRELAKEIKKEEDVKMFHLPHKVIMQIYVASIRVLFEELAISPDKGFLGIDGFGTFYLKKRKCANPIFVAKYNKKYGTNKDYFYTLLLTFKPSQNVADLFNNRKKADSYYVFNHKLYPTEEDLAKIRPKKRSHHVKVVIRRIKEKDTSIDDEKKSKKKSKKKLPVEKVDIKRLPTED